MNPNNVNFNNVRPPSGKDNVSGGTFEKRTVPKGTKDFKDVLEGAKDQSEDKDEELIKNTKDAIEKGAEEALPNLLSLAGKKKAGTEMPESAYIPTEDSEDTEEANESKQQIAFQTPSKQEKIKPAMMVKSSSDDSAGKEDWVPQIPKKLEEVPHERGIEKRGKEKVTESPFAVFQQAGRDKKEKGFSQFSQEQPDLTYVNPLAGPLSAAPASQVADVKPTPRAPYIHQLVAQMIEKLTTVATQGQTDTVVTLKYPPIFEGANLILTSFDTAKKEFNIAFENLSPQAKHLLDLQQNRNDLKLALEEKGYGVHIVTTTTEIEHKVTAEGTLAQQHNRGRQDEDREERRQKRQGQG